MHNLQRGWSSIWIVMELLYVFSKAKSGSQPELLLLESSSLSTSPFTTGNAGVALAAASEATAAEDGEDGMSRLLPAELLTLL